MATAEGFAGYDVATLVNASPRGGLCIVGGLGSTRHWVALSRPGNPTMRDWERQTEERHAAYTRRFVACRRYVAQNGNLLSHGLAVEGDGEDELRRTDPLTGLPFRLSSAYYENLVSRDDVLLPILDDGTFVIVVKDAASPIVAAVIRATTGAAGAQLDRLPRLTDEV